MNSVENLIGRTFSHWTVIERRPDRGFQGESTRYWLCRCDCTKQTEREVCERNLRDERSISCGCSRGGKPSKKFVDLTGKTFGRWTVISKGKIDKNKNQYWLCECSCEAKTQKEVSGKSLVYEKSLSCGCYKREEASDRLKGKPSGQLEDLTGRAFGSWIVVSFGERQYTDYGLRLMWNCRCDCGTERLVDGGTLKGEQSKSCGCVNPFNDLTGKEFGRLTAISQNGRSNDGHVKWLCECSCGNMTTVVSSNLINKHTFSCGCVKLEGLIIRPEHVRKKKAENIQRRYREDIKFNINKRMSSSVRLALRRENSKKVGGWTDAVGYSVNELQERLEQTMPKSYSWDDYLSGVLQIDHIIPLDKFDYKNEEDESFKQAWALTNLRLLYSKDNHIKNNRVISVKEDNENWYGMINGNIVTEAQINPDMAFNLADLAARGRN